MILHLPWNDWVLQMLGANDYLHMVPYYFTSKRFVFFDWHSASMLGAQVLLGT